MAVLTPGKPVTASDPVLQVENRLTPGRYRFQLVVTDTAGLDSAPAELVVTVFQPTPEPAPTPTPRRPVLRPDVIERTPLITDPAILRRIQRP